MYRMLLGLSASVVLALPVLAAEIPDAPHELPDYRALQLRLASGWNSWNTRSVTSYVLLPEGLAFNLAFKQHSRLEERYLGEPLIGRHGADAEKIHPALHAYDGGYTELALEWEQIRVKIESGHDGDDLVVMITPSAAPASPAKVIVEFALLWNRPGSLARDGQVLVADVPGRRVKLFSTATHDAGSHVPARTPYLATSTNDSARFSRSRSAWNRRPYWRSTRSRGPFSSATLGICLKRRLTVSDSQSARESAAPRQ